MEARGYQPATGGGSTPQPPNQRSGAVLPAALGSTAPSMEEIRLRCLTEANELMKSPVRRSATSAEVADLLTVADRLVHWVVKGGAPAAPKAGEGSDAA
jgi:hypothetical protein